MTHVKMTLALATLASFGLTGNTLAGEAQAPVTRDIPIEIGYVAMCPKAQYTNDDTVFEWRWVPWDGKKWPCSYEWPKWQEDGENKKSEK